MSNATSSIARPFPAYRGIPIVYDRRKFYVRDPKRVPVDSVEEASQALKAIFAGHPDFAAQSQYLATHVTAIRRLCGGL